MQSKILSPLKLNQRFMDNPIQSLTETWLFVRSSTAIASLSEGTDLPDSKSLRYGTEMLRSR
jgi:hypothetical protein